MNLYQFIEKLKSVSQKRPYIAHRHSYTIFLNKFFLLNSSKRFDTPQEASKWHEMSEETRENPTKPKKVLSLYTATEPSLRNFFTFLLMPQANCKLVEVYRSFLRSSVKSLVLERANFEILTLIQFLATLIDWWYIKHSVDDLESSSCMINTRHFILHSFCCNHVEGLSNCNVFKLGFEVWFYI